MREGRDVRGEADVKLVETHGEFGPSVDLSSAIDEHLAIIGKLKAIEGTIVELAQRVTVSLREGGKVLWMGNGGSAADSQHMAAEFVGRFARERRGLASVALTTDTSVLTAVANDYSFSNIFSRQIEALCNPQDIVIGISTSGNSENVLHGFAAAKRKGALTVALCGDGGRMSASEAVDICIQVPSHTTARIQEAHILIGHLLCDCVESQFV